MRALVAMTREVVCVTPSDRLVDAFALMTEWEIRHLPVLEGKTIVGILSDRDILARGVFTADSDQLTVGPELSVADAMTEHLITCRTTSDIGDIGETMLTHKIDCLPVVEQDNELIGLITSSDLIQILVDRERLGTRRTLPFEYKIYTSAKPGMTGRRN
jgi:acetoin utilization protein AcuB